MLKPVRAAALAVVLALVAASPAAAQLPVPTVPPLPVPIVPPPGSPLPIPGQPGAGPAPQAYGTNDAGGFLNILPPGENGFDNAPQLAQFEANGDRPPHSSDQLGMYSGLVGVAPHVTEANLGNYFKDARFGVPAGQAERTYSPRSDVTIERDRFGVPHVYGSTRSGTMFGIGYATAEDRLFFIDVLRHLGRAQVSSFVGGSPANRDMDEQQWAVAPYAEADFQKQIDFGRTHFGEFGRLVDQDSKDFISGINAYIARARLNPLDMPAEYAAIGRPQGPDDFQQTDIIAIASLVGGIFGKGGGKELPWAQLLQDFRGKLGRHAGRRAWLDFRDPDDPEAPTTVHNGKRFPYRTSPKHVRKGSVAMPDPGSVKYVLNVVGGADARGGGNGSSASASSASSAADSMSRLLAFPRSSSNALLVSGRETRTGHPLAVFGPQVGYFAPQILMEQDVHGPGIDARGAAFPGVNLYVELGHGRDYAWSATSAGQDIIDTFALRTCQDDVHYVYKGRCLAMEKLQRTNSWTPNAADQTPPGSETLTAYRTALGVVVARATVRGKPVVYTQLRSTYFHEIDSAAGFAAFNDPAAMRTPKAFQRAASKIGYTFNWFFVNRHHVAYFNSGNDPVRTKRTDPLLPVWGRFAWKHWNPTDWTASYAGFKRHARVTDQNYITSWNNKQAPGVAAPDTDSPYTSLFRNQPLDKRIRSRIRGKRTITRTGLVNAMGDAGSVDMRGAYVLPWLLRVIGKRPVHNATARSAVSTLRAWLRHGAHRRDTNHDGVYEQSEAIRIMDAWWPRLVKAQFKPVLGAKVLSHLEEIDPIDNTPNGDGAHLGSSWDVGFYGTVQKDLRRLLHRHVRGKASRTYCGGGKVKRCARALTRSLARAAVVPASRLYHDKTCEAAKRDGDQMCFDSISFRPLGAVTQPLIPWINRPTFQQVVQVP